MKPGVSPGWHQEGHLAHKMGMQTPIFWSGFIWRDGHCVGMHFLLPMSQQWTKKALREMQTLCAGCSKVEPKIFAPPQTPFPWARDGQNLISWRWSLPLPTDQVWWRSMHAISSYRGNRPTNTDTDRTDYNTLSRSLAHSLITTVNVLCCRSSDSKSFAWYVQVLTAFVGLCSTIIIAITINSNRCLVKSPGGAGLFYLSCTVLEITLKAVTSAAAVYWNLFTQTEMMSPCLSCQVWNTDIVAAAFLSAQCYYRYPHATKQKK